MRITQKELQEIISDVQHVYGEEDTINVQELIDYIEAEAELIVER